MTQEQILEKIHKLQILADKGIDGEKIRAQELLDKLKQKYDIDDLSFQSDEEHYHAWKYKDLYEKDLLTWIFYKVIGVDEPYVPVKYKTQKKEVGCYCTDWEVGEINFLFNFYIDLFRKELADFVTAFAKSQKLYPDETSRKWEQHQKELEKLKIEDDKNKGKFFKTEEELKQEQKAYKIANLAANIEKKNPIRVGIETGETRSFK